MDVDWRNVLIIVALAAGHAALSIAIINRVHARGWSRSILHRLGLLDDLLIVALPIVFIWPYSLSEPYLLYGGSWHRLPMPVLGYLAICGAIALALPAIAIARGMRGVPRCQLSNHSQRIDIARRLGYRPKGPGPFAWMTHLPQN